MTPFDRLVEDKVQTIINGGTVYVSDKDVKSAVQKRLREIKKNCTEVLTQLKFTSEDLTGLTTRVEELETTILNRLRQQYKESLNNKSPYDETTRKLYYNTMRLFCLDCSLLSFAEIEEMEYEVENPQKSMKRYVVLKGIKNGNTFWTTNTENNTHLYDGTLAYEELLFTDSHEEAIKRCKVGFKKD